MKHLKHLKKYFWKNKLYFFSGVFFTLFSNYFAVLAPQITKFVINRIVSELDKNKLHQIKNEVSDNYFINKVLQLFRNDISFNKIVFICGILIILLAIIRGFFTYLMRQTLIVMSRHIEFEQKNDIYKHYQQFDASFFKNNSIGDLMNRISEDVSKVRMFTGPAIMYALNLSALIGLCIWNMMQTSPQLTLYTIMPLPILAILIFKINNVIHKKSEEVQQQLSLLTSNVQETYSGIKVIKSFNKEKNVANVFEQNTEIYKKKSISLSKVEAIYFPSISLIIGISTLITILVGGLYKIYGNHNVSLGTIAEFVVYINMLTFPVSNIGWVASMVQRASVSQKRINEFLMQKSNIENNGLLGIKNLESIEFENVNFIYQNTNIQALKNINFSINKNEKIAIVGKTGSGKTTLVQLLMRMYDIKNGSILIDNEKIENYNINDLRKSISYIPQEVFLFSDTIKNNIAFGASNKTIVEIENASKAANIYNEIDSFENRFETIVGERGVTLSGGQKQRISIARALLKESSIYIFDDCLSAVDNITEEIIWNNLMNYLKEKMAIFVTHRIYNLMNFDKILVIDKGIIKEFGSHKELLEKKGFYYNLYLEQNFKE